MDYTKRLEKVAVLGAAGKMGSGILLLTAMEMAELSLRAENRDRTFVLHAVDVSDRGLQELMGFLHSQVKRAAEKKAVRLREWYRDRPDLVENSDIIDQYIRDVIRLVRPTTLLEPAYQSHLIFEAVVEDPHLKTDLLTRIDQHNTRSPWYFTNTSSIPIHTLEEKAGLQGRLIGFHFYNPPAVQRLVELIPSAGTREELVNFAGEYARNLGKKVVPANDVAGFIGNGHFMRDALHGLAELQRLCEDHPFVQSLYMVNRVTQDFLVRPMGIFQLIDYVGLDVCKYIMSVMDPHFPGEHLHSELLDRMIELGVKGGQFADGSQKDGFLQYQKGRPAAVFDPDRRDYVPIDTFQQEADQRLGSLPGSHQPWRAAVGNPDRENILHDYFKDLRKMDTLGARLALGYGRVSRDIAKKLVADGVAKTEKDVNTVLLTGFYHSYGPINEYF